MLLQVGNEVLPSGFVGNPSFTGPAFTVTFPSVFAGVPTTIAPFVNNLGTAVGSPNPVKTIVAKVTNVTAASFDVVFDSTIDRSDYELSWLAILTTSTTNTVLQKVAVNSGITSIFNLNQHNFKPAPKDLIPFVDTTGTQPELKTVNYENFNVDKLNLLGTPPSDPLDNPRLLDIAIDENYIYTTFPDGSGNLQWSRTPRQTWDASGFNPSIPGGERLDGMVMEYDKASNSIIWDFPRDHNGRANIHCGTLIPDPTTPGNYIRSTDLDISLGELTGNPTQPRSVNVATSVGTI
jgi:hypothetical protein